MNRRTLRRWFRAWPGLVLGWASLAALAGEPAVPTFSREVAPILQRRCQSCHRPGEAVPMSLLSYVDARPWAESIKEEVLAKRMPPWHADPAVGRFSNDPTLAREEAEALVRWAAGGAPEGDPRDLPPPLRFTEGWNIGSPDAVFTMAEEHPVPAKGTVPYRYFEIPTGFTEDRWVQAAEVRPGNREVVHHLLVFVLKPGARFRDRLNSGDFWGILLAGTAPGEGPTVFPEGTAKKVPAGSRLLFQVHYTPNGKAATDRSSVGLVFARKPITSEVLTRPIANRLIWIPPGAPAHPVGSSYTFSRDSRLLSLMPHMHLRGRSFEYRATFPDGKELVLLRVPRWDFRWQHIYRLAEPIDMPKGARIRCLATFDNSAQNKANPDPTRFVNWGQQTWEEMMIGFIDIARKPSAPRDPARRERL